MIVMGKSLDVNAFSKTRTLKSATNPRFGDPGHKTIIVDAVWEEISHLGAMAFTADGNDLHEHGQHIFARALSGEFGPIAPCAIDQKAHFDAVKKQLCKDIDRAAHEAHERIDGSHSGTHAAIYAQKIEEAKRMESDKSPKPENYPFLHALVGYQGETLAAVGATIRVSDAAWRLQSAKIERVRAAAKHHITNASTEAQAREVFGDAKFGE